MSAPECPCCSYEAIPGEPYCFAHGCSPGGCSGEEGCDVQPSWWVAVLHMDDLLRLIGKAEEA